MSLPVSYHRSLLKIGLPIVIGQLGVIVLSLADTMMLGHYRTADLAAASFVNNFFNLAIIFATGFSYGLTPLVGRLFGEGNRSAIGGMLKNALLANGVVAGVLTGVMGVCYLYLHRFGQPEELLPLIRPYYLELLISLLFVLLFNAFKQFADGITDTLTPMFILLGGNLLNILGNWLLIYGKWGFPEWGLAGAGLSTLSSRILMCLYFAFFFFTSRRYRVYRAGFMQSCLNRTDFLQLNRLGWPVALQMGMETASFSLAAILVGWMGVVALAAHQVMLSVSQLGYMIYYGLAAAVAVKVSLSYGQRDAVAVRAFARAGMQLIGLLAIVLSVVLLCGRHQLGSLFTAHEEVSALVAQLVIPFVVYQFGDGLQCAYSNALRGISDVKRVTYYAFIAYFLISLPSAYLFGFTCQGGLVGLWYSFPLGLTSAGLMFYFRFRKMSGKIA
ncbi:MAG: MATE family efflux transporter [Parabacteroides sp.]